MCPSGGRVGGVRDRLRRVIRDGLNRELQPVALLLPAALLLLLFVYCWPGLSALLLLCVLAGWAYSCAGGRWWRLPEPGPRAAAGRQRLVQHRRAALRWTPASLLLLMGSYLGKPEPPVRAVGRGARDLRERLARPNPAVPTPARRLSFRETPIVINRTFMSPRRRYPTHQPQFSMPGSLPSVYIDGFPRKPLLSPKHSQMRSPGTVKIARPDANIARSPVLNSLLSTSLTSPSVTCPPPDPCAKETVLNAIRERRKRINKDEEYNGSGEMENKRRRQVSSENGESSADSPVVNGSLACVSKSDTLKRALNTLDETSNKRSRTSSNSSLSSCAMNGFTIPSHNAITSSYSSSRVLLQKRKRNCQNTSEISSPSSSRSQTPDVSSKKARDDMHETGLSTPVKSGSRDQSEDCNTTSSSKSSAFNSSENGSGGPRRKKVLLVCSGRGDLYPLPPPPIVGYNITSKDLDYEKKAFLQRLNKALEEPADLIPVTSTPPVTTMVTASPLFILSNTTSALTSQTSTAGSNPLLQSLAKMQSKEGSQEPVQTVAADFPNQKVVSLGLSPKDVSGENVSLKLVSPPPAVAPSISAPQPNGAVQNKADSNSSLLQLLTQPTLTDSQSSFKPLFPSNVGAAPPIVSSSGPSVPSVTSTNTFKPIFGEQSVQQNLPASTFKPIFGDSSLQQPAVTSASPFTFQVNSNPTSTAPPSFPGFGATVTSTTPSTDSGTKPSISLPASSSATTSFSAAFPAAITSSSTATSAPTNSFLGSSTSLDSQTKTTFVFGQAPTSQATPGLSVFGNTQTAPTAQPPQSSIFGSTTSAFSAAHNSNPPPYPASSGASTYNSSGSGIQADKPAPNSLASFGTSGAPSTFGSGTLPTFGGSSQTAFGANSQPAFGSNVTFAFGTGSAPATTNPMTFGSMNSTQTNSTPATGQFGASKSFSFGEKTNTSVSFGSTTSTVPAPAMTFGNSSAAHNSTHGTPGLTENKLSFGTPAAPFGQNASPAPINFGTPTSSFGSPAPTSFGQSSHGFSIGVTSKSSGTRQRLMARRQHTRKK
ncbi:nuclear envelope pore membrane protein POM 121 isoform X1 [Ranitomeya variabilis]|uniref:nuclear envelope pore membrane protein POM 121 isoform X1 n=2 Tax=Ranitomeya variabilis TaxID=490064 RepID=UPI004055DD51